MNTNKILVAMSGGVDSSTTAYLLQKEGNEIIGATMKLIGDDIPAHTEEEIMCSEKTCCSLSDVEDARSVCVKMSCPYYVFNYTVNFEEKVIAPFAKSYQEGITPNPCIYCNMHLKFGSLLERARNLGCDKIATGHYATVEYRENTGRWCLRKAKDTTKDQTYVLYSMSQEELSQTVFPLGIYTKEEVREMAEEAGLINARKHDSQDICFVPDGDYAGFLERYLTEKSGCACTEDIKGLKPGNFVSRDGKVLGVHKGICHYTIGQRKGLGLPAEKPYYVVEIDADRNEVVLGDNEDLFRKDVNAKEFNWVSVLPEIGESLKCSAKIRYRHKESPAVITRVSESEVSVIFEEPQRAITRGQALVVYDGDYVLGGGVIC